MVANTYTIREVVIGKSDVLASKDIVDYAKSRGWHNPAGGSFDFAATYANPQAAAHPNNLGRQWSGLQYIVSEPLKEGSNLPFSVKPRHKLAAADVMQILRHDKEAESSSAPAAPFLCALCSGATQTSFVAQLRNEMPLDMGIVYWVTLASPRTSFYVPFHFGIADFPVGYKLSSQRPESPEYDGKVQAEFKLDVREAFWTFSNFRDKMDRKGSAAMERLRVDQQRVERDAVQMQRLVEEAALRLYKKDAATSRLLLENYSRGVYLSAMEAMGTVLSAE